MAADPDSTRFEVLLTADETARVTAAMAARGIRSRAAWLRLSLLGDRGDAGAELSAAIGTLGLVLNELLLHHDAAVTVDPAVEFSPDLEKQIRRLVAHGQAVYGDLVRLLRNGGG